jgi:DNA-binding beta-propeller fold protein YncE
MVHPHAHNVLYTNSTTSENLAVYTFDETGLKFAGASRNPGAGLPCWFLMNRGGTRLYTLNSLSNTISIFDTSHPLHPEFITSVQTSIKFGFGTPSQFVFDPSQRLMWVSSPRNFDLMGALGGPPVPPDHGSVLHTFSVDADGMLQELATSPVRLPLPVDTTADGFVAF